MKKYIQETLLSNLVSEVELGVEFNIDKPTFLQWLFSDLPGVSLEEEMAIFGYCRDKDPLVTEAVSEEVVPPVGFTQGATIKVKHTKIDVRGSVLIPCGVRSRWGAAVTVASVTEPDGHTYVVVHDAKYAPPFLRGVDND